MYINYSVTLTHCHIFHLISALIAPLSDLAAVDILDLIVDSCCRLPITGSTNMHLSFISQGYLQQSSLLINLARNSR
jgi:hypothetical protein